MSIRGVGPVVVVADSGFGDNEKHTFTVPLEQFQTEPATYRARLSRCER